MSDIEEEMEKFEAEIESRKTSNAQAEGRRSVAQETLEKLGAKTVKEADSIISDLDSNLEAIDEEIEHDFSMLKEEYKWES